MPIVEGANTILPCNINASNVEGVQMQTAGQNHSSDSASMAFTLNVPTNSHSNSNTRIDVQNNLPSKSSVLIKPIKEWSIEDVVCYISTIDICAKYAQVGLLY